jgi:hypothetical protein
MNQKTKAPVAVATLTGVKTRTHSQMSYSLSTVTGTTVAGKSHPKKLDPLGLEAEP